MDRVDDIIDLARFPLDRLNTVVGQSFVETCRQQVEQQGCCSLPGFLLPAAVKAAQQDALSVKAAAHQVNHNFAYDDVNDEKLQDPVEALPQNHPRRFKSLTRIRFVARDLISANNPVKVIHDWEGLTKFIGEVMSMNPVFTSACPLSGCILTVAEEGELQDWHFDGNEFIVTLMLEAADEGGDFEYAPGLRSNDLGDDYENISRVLQGHRDQVIKPAIAAGTLTLFRGKYNLHRASPVGQDCRRIMAVLSYENKPNVTGTNEYLKLFYGRSLQEF